MVKCDYEGIAAALAEGFDSGVNEKGEYVVIGRCAGGAVYARTLQGNGWARVDYYHEDGTVEETYER